MSGFRHGQVWGAERIGRALVARRLAACVNLLAGVVSIYRGRGAVQRDEERLLVIKTTAVRIEPLREALAALYPYSFPSWWCWRSPPATARIWRGSRSRCGITSRRRPGL